MPFYTPLRYPGGKRRLAPVVGRLLQENRIIDANYAEPYAGGAAVALSLLFEERAATIHINDLARTVFSFWHTVLNHNADMCQRIKTVDVTMDEWHRQRDVYDNRESADGVDLGFATLFLNRTNRSGIIGGGVIGGKAQNGAWKVDARFNKTELIQRIKRIGRYRNRIHLYQLDALKFVTDVVPGIGANTFSFYDPPYVEKSEDLYLNTYDVEGHRALARAIERSKTPWLVTYDHAAIATGLFSKRRRLIYGLNYSAQDRYEGKEVMFLSDGLKLPSDWRTTTAFLLSDPRSHYPLYGKMQKMKPAAPEMIEGEDALERFKRALKTVVAVKKAELPPKPTRSTKKATKAKP